MGESPTQMSISGGSQLKQSWKKLEFITFNDLQMAKSARNRQLVRSQAVRNSERRVVVPRRRTNTYEHVFALPLRKHEKEESEMKQNEVDEERVSPSLVTVLDTSRFDPFFQYPIEMGYRERELTDHR